MLCLPEPLGYQVAESKQFDACFGINFPPKLTEDMGGLLVCAVLFDSVAKVMHMSDDDNCGISVDDEGLERYLEFVKPLFSPSSEGIYSRPEDVEEALWQTMAAEKQVDQNIFGKKAPSDHGRRFRVLCDPAELPANFAPDVENRKQVYVIPFLNAYIRSIDDRCLFISEKGYLGLGPANAREKGRVCIVFGALVPFILRPESEHYVLIGESYIHGVMYGELIDEPVKDLVEMKEIEIR